MMSQFTQTTRVIAQSLRDSADCLEQIALSSITELDSTSRPLFDFMEPEYSITQKSLTRWLEAVSKTQQEGATLLKTMAENLEKRS